MREVLSKTTRIPKIWLVSVVAMLCMAWALPGYAATGPESDANDVYWDDQFPLNFDGTVYALVKDASGNVYAGGGFTTAGGVVANRVAKWNGSAWSALGSGMDSWVTALAVDASEHVKQSNFAVT